jgi:hypothetical protein
MLEREFPPRTKAGYIAELVGDVLAANLRAQRAILETVTSAEYIERQDAAVVAALYASICDQSYHLLSIASAVVAEVENVR